MQKAIQEPPGPPLQSGRNAHRTLLQSQADAIPKLMDGGHAAVCGCIRLGSKDKRVPGCWLSMIVQLPTTGLSASSHGVTLKWPEEPYLLRRVAAAPVFFVI